MPLDSDVALLGTGVAPLVAARHLLAEGKSVLVLNPDWDFFLEDSELSLDPLIADGALRPGIDRVMKSLSEPVLETLRPSFPGAVEFWSSASEGAGASSAGFRDPAAPHVRARGRLWLGNGGLGDFEDLYVEASDSGLHPQILEGIQAAHRFPGIAAAKREELRGLWIPHLCDVDVVRYRNGLLEFVRERLGPERVVCDASQVELMPGGVRFHAHGESTTARLSQGLLVFWTPRLSSWIMSQAKKLHVQPRAPMSVRLWEQWSLISREPVDPSVVGVLGEMAAWAESEGDPAFEGRPLHRISVLRAGQAPSGLSWGSTESFQRLSSLFHDCLSWDYVTIRGMKPRTVLEWPEGGPLTWALSDQSRVVNGGDGPLFEVVRRARQACEELESAS